MLNDEEKKVLLAILRHENDILWWQKNAVNELKIDENDLIDVLHKLAVYHFIRLDVGNSLFSIKEITLVDSSIGYLYDENLIFDAEYNLYMKRHQYGQTEV